MSQTRFAIGVVLSFFAVALSGCIGGDDAEPTGQEPQAGPADFDENTGAVEGQVLTEEGLPIPRAQVGLIAGEAEPITTTTDEVGRFTLSNVQPGEYQLHIQALGFEATARNIQVSAGSATTVEVQLAVVPTDDPWVETLNHGGQYGTGVAFIRTTLCYQCNQGEATTWFFFGGFPDDFAGMIVEVDWETSDSLGFDLNTRSGDCDPSCMWYRARSTPPLRFEALACEDYTGAPAYGRVPMPCTQEDFEKTQGDSGASAARLETWYIGQYEEEAHTLDPVCQTPTGPLPGYEAGCYGVGVAPELRWQTWVTIFHKELPADYQQMSAFPDQ